MAPFSQELEPPENPARFTPILEDEHERAIQIDDDTLPSRWQDRAARLRQALGSRTEEVQDYLRNSGLPTLLAGVEDADDIVRFGTPRLALIVYALASALRVNGADRMGLAEAVGIAEPTATDGEIQEAAHAALAWAATSTTPSD